MVKFNRDGESLPYQIPLSCLVSLLNLPPIAPSWTPEILDDYSEKHQFGFNIYKLLGNKAELSIHFPGETDLYNLSLVKILGESRFQKSVTIGARDWPSNNIYWLPAAKNIKMKYQCKKPDCGYNSNRSNNVKQHEEVCKTETVVSAKPWI